MISQSLQVETPGFEEAQLLISKMFFCCQKTWSHLK